MAEFHILYTPGDGIGPEIVEQGRRVLEAIGACFGHTFTAEHAVIGAGAVEAHGIELTDEVIDRARAADAILLGACGIAGGVPVQGRHPERAVLTLRQELELWANLRPMKVIDHLIDASPVKPEVLRGVDMLVLRELTGGAYFGEPRGPYEVNGQPAARDTMVYSEPEVRRVVTRAFELAAGRHQSVTSVDKANVLESSALWRRVAEEVAAGFPDIKFESILVDAFSMRLVQTPRDFDVVVTGNLFGDILSDEMAVLAASLGVLPSASLGEGRAGLYEPIHGAANDIAGRDIANPIATILSAALMLRYSFELETEARTVEHAVDAVLARGVRTPDIQEDGSPHVGTAGMCDAIIAEITAH
jgi:3-isopropylmalate dehydrogenase